MSRVLFVSDVHLNPTDPGRQARFVDFLLERKDVAHLYIVGDLFDYWIGPAHLESEDYRPLLAGLRKITRNGMRVSFVPGNRDYFVDRGFADATGVDLLPAETSFDLGGRRVFLAHGDFLYNKNPKYTAYRRVMRFGMLRSGYLALPARVQKRMALGFRKVSVRTTPEADWTDAELLGRAARIFQQGMDVVICGHIHLPRHLQANGKDLFILGDWRDGGEYVEFDGESFDLVR